jgi:hypothetical protein
MLNDIEAWLEMQGPQMKKENVLRKMCGHTICRFTGRDKKSASRRVLLVAWSI